ncbi:MAG: ferredoxin [Longimicrobiales bacterium]
MSDFLERRIGRLTIRIDRHLCVGFGDCVDVAPEVFVLDDDSIARFCNDTDVAEDLVLRACRSCPVDALSAIDESGRTVHP